MIAVNKNFATEYIVGVFSDVLNGTGESTSTVQRALWTFNNFDAFDID